MFKLLIFVLLLPGNYCLNERDFEVLSTLNQRFLTRRCILVSTQEVKIPNYVERLKNFSERNIYSVHLNVPNLSQYLLKENLEFDKTMIILKANNNSELQYILEELNKISPKNILPKFKWILILPNNANNITENNFYVPFNVEFFILRETASKFIITEIYQVSKNFCMTNTNFGLFYNKSNFKFNEMSLHQRRNNLQGKIMITEIRDQGPCKFLGDCLHFEILNDFRELFNFSIKTFKRKEIALNSSIIKDISLFSESFHSFTHDKNELMGPILRSKVHLYIRDIGKRFKTWDVYLMPFEHNLWIAVAAWVLFSVVLLTIMGCLGNRLHAPQDLDLRDHGLIPLTALCYQGFTPKLDNISTKMAVMVICIACGFLLPSYSAFIISFLTMDRQVIPFTDYESFIKDGTYRLMCPYYKFFIAYFKKSNDPLLQKIRNEYLEDPKNWPPNHEGAINMLCTQEKLAFINTNYKMIVKRSPCKIIIVSQNLMTFFSARRLGIEAEQYKKLFVEKIVRYHEAGFTSYMEKKLYAHTSSPTRKEFETIDIDTTKSLLIFLSAAIIISALILFLERLYYLLT